MMRRNLLSESVASVSSLPANTVFKLGTNGLVGAQNNIFLDTPTNSRTANTITRYGNVTQGAFTPYSKEAGKWSNWFSPASEIRFANSSNFAFGTGDYLIEGWFYFTQLPSEAASIFRVGNVSIFYYAVASNVRLAFLDSTITTFPNMYRIAPGTSGTLTTGKFMHLALERVSGTVRLYKDGIVLGTLTGDTTNYTTALPAIVGEVSSTSGWGLGMYATNLRAIKGGFAYNGAFTPSFALPQASGTVVLDTCKDNRFKDNSVYNHTLTPTGNVKVSPFSPYANSAGYDAAVYGGSGYFDGSGDYLSIADNSAFDISSSVDFTVSADVFLTAFPSSGKGAVIINKRGASIISFWLAINSTGVVQAIINNNSYVSTLVISTGTFNRIELVLTAANALTVTVNGIQFINVTGITRNNQTAAVLLGGYPADSQYLTGYIHALRITKAGTEVLNLKFNNAGIRDLSGMNNIETVGDAKVSSDGQGVVFDGSVDYLWFNQPNLTSLGAGVFELSVDVLTNSSSQQFIWGWRNGGDTSPYLFINGSGKVTFAGDTTTFVVDTSAVSLGVLYTFKVTRQSDNYIRLYRNGNLVATSASPITTDFSYDNSKYIGAANGTSSYYFNGTIKNLTITKGA
jgi:autonomous glycyl radical cofactor GrcA